MSMKAFRQPGFPLLFVGLFASMLGDSLMLIVLAVWVKDLTGSNAQAGVTFFFVALPSLIAPVFGVLVDRVRRSTTLIWGNAASAVAVLPLVVVRDQDDVWIIYAVALLYGISFVVLPAALNGLLKQLLPDELLVDANASLSTAKEALRLIGPLVGAGLFTAFGGGTVAVIDAITFVVAAVAIVALRLSEPRPVRDAGHWKQEFGAGISHVRSDRILFHTLMAIGAALLVIGFMESAVFAMVDAFDKPASYVGVVVCIQGIGAVAGGAVSARIVRRLGEVPAVAASMVCFAVGLGICAAVTSLTLTWIGIIVLGFSLPVFIVSFTTLLQRRTPTQLMGRVSTAADVVLGTPQALSIALGALLVTVISYRTMYAICAAVVAGCAVYLGWVLRGTEAIKIASPDRGADESLNQ